jgi:Tetratricopeptide repeat
MNRSNPRLRPLTLALRISICVASVCLIAGLWGPVRAAWITRDDVADPAVYERALGLDPDNPEYHFTLAEIYHLSARFQDGEKARAHYEAAVASNPHRSAHWLGLSRLLETQRDPDGAREAMARALETDPHYAQTYWAAANLYLRLGDLDLADEAMVRAAELDVGYLQQVLDLVWRFYADPKRIMDVYVPDTKNADLTALGYFILRENDAGADLAWERLRAFETGPADRMAYVNYLITRRRNVRAYEVFLAGEEGPGVFNGGMEAELLNGGFDWRFPARGPVSVRRDTLRAEEGRASLRIEFDGKENLNFSGVWHWLPVEPGRTYELSFAMRSEEISTDQGIYVEVDGEVSEPAAGTTPWRSYTIPFTASSDLVRIRVRRNPSRKFDSLLGGSVWLDDFQLASLDES